MGRGRPLPLHVTIAPVLLTIVLTAVSIGAITSVRALHGAKDFATHYDQFYAPLTLQDGKLSAGEIPPGKFLPRMRMNLLWRGPTTLVVDLTGKTPLAGVDTPALIVVAADSVTLKTDDGDESWPLSQLMSLFPTQSATIDSPHLVAWLNAAGGLWAAVLP